jgi:hypothetical protein
MQDVSSDQTIDSWRREAAAEDTRVDRDLVGRTGNALRFDSEPHAAHVDAPRCVYSDAMDGNTGFDDL